MRMLELLYNLISFLAGVINLRGGNDCYVKVRLITEDDFGVNIINLSRILMMLVSTFKTINFSECVFAVFHI